MHLRVAAINDLSGLGRCSLTADIAVLAAMGIEACPMPTAVLTSQTGYPGYRCLSFADRPGLFGPVPQTRGAVPVRPGAGRQWQGLPGLYRGFH